MSLDRDKKNNPVFFLSYFCKQNKYSLKLSSLLLKNLSPSLFFLCFALIFNWRYVVPSFQANFPSMSWIPSFLPPFGEACDGWLVHLFNSYSLLTGPGLHVGGIQGWHSVSSVVMSLIEEADKKTIIIQCDWSLVLEGSFASPKAGCQIHSGRTREDFLKVAAKLRLGHESEQHAKERERMAEARPLLWCICRWCTG